MTIVQTNSGPLRGARENGLAVFRGVPYAAPPVGELRWMPPRPHLPWTEPRDALEFGNVAPQEKSSLIPPAALVEHPESEDCLYLNVWTPAADDGARPVMLWIHGGGFAFGAGSEALYDGSALAARDVVVVTVNYRLGPLGFVRLKELTNGAIPSTGNEGLLDQVAALEWVRDNIAVLGGDADNVTIFGESAGGASVQSLLSMPAARGLFHKAIVQSGPGHTHFNVDEAVDKIARPMLEALGTMDPEALRSITADGLLAAIPPCMESLVSRDLSVRTHWAKPVVDGETMPDWSESALASGAQSGMPLMVGTTRDEMSMEMLANRGDGTLVERVQALVPGVDAAALVEAYRAARERRLAPVDDASLFAAIDTGRMLSVPSYAPPGCPPAPWPGVPLRVRLDQSRHGRRERSAPHGGARFRVRDPRCDPGYDRAVRRRSGGRSAGERDDGRLDGVRPDRRPEYRRARAVAGLRRDAGHDDDRAARGRAGGPFRGRTGRLGRHSDIGHALTTGATNARREDVH